MKRKNVDNVKETIRNLKIDLNTNKRNKNGSKKKIKKKCSMCKRKYGHNRRTCSLGSIQKKYLNIVSEMYLNDKLELNNDKKGNNKKNKSFK